jgi:hypothetical protein
VEKPPIPTNFFDWDQMVAYFGRPKTVAIWAALIFYGLVVAAVVAYGYEFAAKWGLAGTVVFALIGGLMSAAGAALDRKDKTKP